MEVKLTRRQFGQLAIAGAVVAAIGNFNAKFFHKYLHLRWSSLVFVLVLFLVPTPKLA